LVVIARFLGRHLSKENLMPWSSEGGNGGSWKPGSPGPWGQKPGAPPPEFEEFLKRAQEKLKDYDEKKPYQWFTLLICVARSAYFSKAAQNSAAVSNRRSSASRTGRGRCGASGA
jgi:hypothetical protein